MAIRSVGERAQTVLQHMVATGGEAWFEWRVVEMDGPFARTSQAYDDLELVRRIQAARGGRIERRVITEWAEPDG